MSWVRGSCRRVGDSRCRGSCWWFLIQPGCWSRCYCNLPCYLGCMLVQFLNQSVSFVFRQFVQRKQYRNQFQLCAVALSFCAWLKGVPKNRFSHRPPWGSTTLLPAQKLRLGHCFRLIWFCSPRLFQDSRSWKPQPWKRMGCPRRNTHSDPSCQAAPSSSSGAERPPHDCKLPMGQTRVCLF